MVANLFIMLVIRVNSKVKLDDDNFDNYLDTEDKQCCSYSKVNLKHKNFPSNLAVKIDS